MIRALVSAVFAVALSFALLPSEARACGGFFCNGGGGPPPVVQTGEKIIFAADGDQVTAQVQILYQGDPRKFAWVVPVPSLPTIEVGSDQVFTIFDAATQPSFNINWTGFCQRGGREGFGCGCGAPFAAYDKTASGAPVPEEVAPSVTVVSQQPVGPYDSAILSATDPNALETWLSDNGFDLAPEAKPLISSYVDKGDYFVALKLQSDRANGDLQPVVLHYTSTEGPCVPIRLTKVAATPDLGIAVFVLGDKRAVPANYLQLELNEAKIDWINQGTNYSQVVTDAANEAGGHGFVTDYAGSNNVVAPQISSALVNYDRDAVADRDPVTFVKAVRNAGFLGSSQNVLAILNRCVPPPGAPSDGGLAYYNRIELASPQPMGLVDQPSCGDDIDRLVAKPLRDMGALLQKLPKLTRLYTTMSPDEMTEDPIFTFNGELPDVSTAHTISAQQNCDGTVDFTTQAGRTFEVPYGSTAEKEPSLAVGYEVHAMGQPIVVVDNRDQLGSKGSALSAAPPSAAPEEAGCAVAPDFSVFALTAGLMALRARRRDG